MSKLILALPKGSLQQATFKVGSRSYVPTVDDDDLDTCLIRALDMSRDVEMGLLDVGIIGYHRVRSGPARTDGGCTVGAVLVGDGDGGPRESDGCANCSDIHEVGETICGNVDRRPIRWVLTRPQDCDIHSVKDLGGKRIATEVVLGQPTFGQAVGVTAQVEFSGGAAAVKPPVLVDAIVGLTETENYLRVINLRMASLGHEQEGKMLVTHLGGIVGRREEVGRQPIGIWGCLPTSLDTTAARVDNLFCTLVHLFVPPLPKHTARSRRLPPRGGDNEVSNCPPVCPHLS